MRVLFIILVKRPQNPILIIKAPTLCVPGKSLTQSTGRFSLSSVPMIVFIVVLMSLVIVVCFLLHYYCY